MLFFICFHVNKSNTHLNKCFQMSSQIRVFSHTEDIILKWSVQCWEIQQPIKAKFSDLFGEYIYIYIYVYIRIWLLVR